jgi:ferredoxin-NADP reductase
MIETKAVFIERIKRTPTVESFRFRPKENISFLAGQFLQLIFDQENKNNQELNKYLSFSCAPGKEYIEITKRLSASLFSQQLNNLTGGDEVLIKAPLGTCYLTPADKQVGFLIGGIGITPVIAIIEDIIEKHLNNDIILFYSNRRAEEIAFENELDTWARINPRIKVFYRLSEGQADDRRYSFGVIDQDFLLTNDSSFSQRTLFIFGPPKMVEAMKNLCRQAGSTAARIKTETFVGY